MNVNKKVFFSLCVVIIIILTVFFNNKSTQVKSDYETFELLNNNYDYGNLITDNSEINSEYVIFISDGMDENDFLNIFSKTSKYIKSSGTYKHINYDFEKHLTYSKLERIYLSLNDSDIVNLEIIGNSFDGRNIYSLEIGKGNDVTMFEGNIHAAEIGPALYLTKFAVDLVNNYEIKDPEILDFLNNHKIVIVPSANPDGYDYTIFGRNMIRNKNSYAYLNDNEIDPYYYKANVNGVDLNRNFPSQLGGLYFSDNELSSFTVLDKSTKLYEYFPGNSLGSESETKALMYWIYKYYKDTKSFISLHSAGQVIYDEQQYLSDTFNDEGRKCAEILEKYTGYEIVGVDFDDGFGTDGNSTDFIEELAHGYVYSTKTGRLSTLNYAEQVNEMTQKMCVLTVETLENYTQDLDIIRQEWYDKQLEKALIDIVKR